MFGTASVAGEGAADEPTLGDLGAKVDRLQVEMKEAMKILHRIDRRGAVTRQKRMQMPSGWKARYDYVDEWNAAAAASLADVPRVEKLTPARAQLLKKREVEEAFDWPAITAAVRLLSPGFLSSWSGFGFDWIVSDTQEGKVESYVRLIEGRYERKPGERAPSADLGGYFEKEEE